MRWLFFCLTVGLHAAAFAQSTNGSYSLPKGYRFKQAWADGNTIYVLGGRSDWYYFSNNVAVVQHTVGASTIHKLVLEANHQPAYLLHAYWLKHSLYLVCSVPLAGKVEMGWCVLRCDSMFTNALPVTDVIVAPPLLERWLLRDDLTPLVSPDSMSLAFCVAAASRPDEPQRMRILVASVRQPKNYRCFETSLPSSTRNERLQLLLTNDGTAYALVKEYPTIGAEVMNGHANYRYNIHLLNDKSLPVIATLPMHNRILQSVNIGLSGNNFFASGLISDTTTQRLDSVWTARLRITDGMLLDETVAALHVVPMVSNSFELMMDNTVRNAGNDVLSMFEQVHTEYNNAMKSDQGFAYERGSTVAVLSDVNNRIKKISTIYKWQRFTKRPDESLFPTTRSDSLYVVYVTDTKDDKHDYQLHAFNMQTEKETITDLSKTDWEKETPYLLLPLTSGFALVQPLSRNYLLLRFP